MITNGIHINIGSNINISNDNRQPWAAGDPATSTGRWAPWRRFCRGRGRLVRVVERVVLLEQY